MADSFDFSQLQGILGQFQPNDDEKRRALTQALASAGFGILGARGVNGMQALGQGGLLGLNSYNDAMQQSMLAKRAGLTNALGALQLREGMQKFSDQDALRQLQQDVISKYPLIASPGMPQPTQAGVSPNTAAQFGPPAQAANSGFNGGVAQPAPPTASAQPAAAPSSNVISQSDGLARKRAMSDAYRQQAAMYAQSANPLAQTMAQQLMDKADKVLPQLKDQQVRTDPQTGQRVVVNVYNDGSQEILRDVGPDKEKLNIQNTGGAIVGLDPFTGQPASAPIPMTMSPDAKASNALGYANLAENKRYHNMELGIGADGQPGNLDAAAQAIATYQMAPLSGWAMSKPMGAALMGKVMQINPTYDAKNYGAAQQTLNAFSKGTQGNTVRSISAAMQHMDVAQQAFDALANGNVPLFNKAANALAQQTGQAAPQSFEATKDIVSKEIAKAIIGSGAGTGTERKAIEDAMSRANSPAQMAGVLGQYRNLFTGQLNALAQQYKAGTGQDDFQKRFLTPQTAALMSPGASGWTVKRID